MKGCILDILFHFIKMNYYGKMNGHGEVYGQSRSKEFDRAVKYIKEKCKSLPPPSVGIVCGSGLNEIGAKVKEKITIPYSEIPDFPQATGRPIKLCSFLDAIMLLQACVLVI